MADSTALLFYQTEAPVVLSKEAPTSVGRHSECGLCVRHEDVSRRHAEVFFRDDAWWVRDLGSTNGTWLHSEAVRGERRLESGDAIELGSCPVTFCEVARDSASSTHTGLLAAPGNGESFKGRLTELPAGALFQLIELGRKSGVVDMLSADVAGRIWFRVGMPLHAETEKNSGFDAALVLCGVNDGHFRFQPGNAPPETTIQASVAQLLAEASRDEDEL